MEKTNSCLTRREIDAQPASFAAIQAALPEILQTLDRVFARPYDQLIFTGCGTSLYLAQTAAQAWNRYNDTPAQAVCCSELYFFPQVYCKGRRVLVLPITRKSCTTEVRRAIDRVRARDGVSTLAITCDPDSACYNDAILLSPDTAEESVIMTRSFTSMVYLAVILALHQGGRTGEIRAMAEYPAQAARLLRQMDALAGRIVAEHPALELFITLGQGVYYGVANECMNKIKEMGLAHSEAYCSLEYRHGPMSLVDEHTLVLTLAHPDTRAEDAALLEQMKRYGAVTAVVGEQVAGMPGADYRLDLGCGYSAEQSAALIGMIGQLLGCHIAAARGIDADSPRHLSQAIVLQEP